MRALCLAMVLMGCAAWGQTPSVDTGAEGACERAAGAASGESALLMSPELFASLGVVSASLNGDSLGSPTPRLMVGADYSLSKLMQGFAVKARARAACERARALARLVPALDAGADLGLLPALTARAHVLAEVLPRAEAIVQEVQAEVRDDRASREELNAVSQQLDALRRVDHDTALALARLSTEPRVPLAELRQALAAYRDADARYEALGGTLRARSAWDVSVRGGYERLFDVQQSVPLFGMLTVSYNLGGLFQARATRRAVAGARAETDADATGEGARIRAMVRGLAAELDADRARLAQTRTHLADLRGQQQALQAIQTHAVDRFRRAVFFQLAQAQAEDAFLSARVESLQALSGDPR